MKILHHHGTPQKEGSDRVRQLQGNLAGSACRQDTAEDHRSPPQRVLRARGDPVGGTVWFPTEPFYHRYDVCGSSVTGVGTEETIPALCMLYRPYQSVGLRRSNPPLDSTRPFWRASEYDLGHSSIPPWHANMRAARRQGVLEVVRCGTRSSSSVRARAPPVQHLLRGGYKRGLHAFQGGQRHHGRFGTPEEEKGDGGAGESNCRRVRPRDAAWGMIYADDAGVVSQSPEQLRKMMGVVVVVCAAFGLTVSEAKTEIMCLRAKGVPEPTAKFNVEAAGQVYNQTNEFVYLGGNVNRNADLSIEVDRRIRSAWCSFRKYALEL